MTTDMFCETIDIDFDDLDKVVGGAGIDPAIWDQVKTQAGPWCPKTVKQYGGMDPATITQSTAENMANACVAEMPFYAKGKGRAQLDAGLGKAFPDK